MSAPARPQASAPEKKPAALLRMLRNPENNDNLKALFDDYDTNRNGTIEREELKNLLVKIYATPQFGGFDISENAEEMVDHLTKAVDVNNDGVLQFDEFIRAINIISAGEETD